ncbi:MAG TPA: carboxymuconolactone decarboxylase family protein [Actinomycetota bacterium]|jgi:alkylhydroperoxidase family enzyme
MARISLDPPQTLSSRIAEWFIRRRFGEVLEPMRIIGHHPQVSRAVGQLEQHAQRWRRMDVKIRDLAEMAAVAKVGCSWCMDFGYWVMHGHGLSREKIEAVPHWRDSELFDPLERLVIEYAEAMTETPPTVDDELVKRLLEHLDEAQGYSPQVGAVGLEPPPSASRARASGYHPLSRSVITSDEQNPAGVTQRA